MQTALHPGREKMANGVTRGLLCAILPRFVDVLHLVDVAVGMLLVGLEPCVESHRATFRMLDGVRPNRIRESPDQFVRRFAKMFEQLKGCVGTLIMVSERFRPSVFIVAENDLTRFGNVSSAPDEAVCLTVGDMDNDLVDAPPIRCWLIFPHPLGKFAEGFLQCGVRVPVGANFIFSFLRSHWSPVDPHSSLIAFPLPAPVGLLLCLPNRRSF